MLPRLPTHTAKPNATTAETSHAMTTFTRSAWLSCTHPGCVRGTYADPRHVPNLTAGGGWTCPEHEDEK